MIDDPDALKNFIRNNYSEEIQNIFNKEKALGLNLGLQEGRRALEVEERALEQQQEALKKEIDAFSKRKKASEAMETELHQRYQSILGLLETIEKVLQEERLLSKADIARVVAHVFKATYGQKEISDVLKSAILKSVDELPEPQVTIELSKDTAALVERSLLSAGAINKVKVSESLHEGEANIITDSIIVKVSLDKVRQVFKNNLQDVVNAI